MTRNDIINETAEIINNIELPHPVRIGIDGVGASGKTYFADELVKPLEELGRTVIRTSLDGFHNPPEIRRRQGAFSAKGYLEDSFNYEAVVKSLLNPLGPEGDLLYRESIYNFVENENTNVSVYKAPSNAILIFEGVFLFNDFLLPYWDYKLFIDTDFEETYKRAQTRDVKRLGGIDKLKVLYEERYIPGQKMYLDKFNPHHKADIVINNNNFKNPIVTKMSNHNIHKSSKLFARKLL